MRPFFSRSLLWFALAALAACTPVEPVTTPTQVTVRITSSDSALQAVMTQLTVRASMKQGETGWRKPVFNSFPTNGLSWPVDVPVFPRNASEASGQFEVVAEAVQNDVVLAEARAITNFIPGKHVQLEIRLFACPGRDRGFVCTPGCQGANCLVCNASGECESIIPIDPNQLPQTAGVSEMLEAGTSRVDAMEGGGISNPAPFEASTPVQVVGDGQAPVVTHPAD